LEQVLRVWALLASSKGFDPAVLRPLVPLAQERKVKQFGERITSELFNKMTARAVRNVLRRTQPPKPAQV
jgi:aarF domain-containing kinase